MAAATAMAIGSDDEIDRNRMLTGDKTDFVIVIRVIGDDVSGG
jgi:hypothetical protein